MAGERPRDQDAARGLPERRRGVGGVGQAMSLLPWEGAIASDGF